MTVIKMPPVEEIFGAATAAVISPVGLLSHLGKSYELSGGKTGELAQRLFDELIGIQYGKKPDPFQWIHQVDLHGSEVKTPISTAAV